MTTRSKLTRNKGKAVIDPSAEAARSEEVMRQLRFGSRSDKSEKRPVDPALAQSLEYYLVRGVELSPAQATAYQEFGSRLPRWLPGAVRLRTGLVAAGLLEQGRSA